MTVELEFYQIEENTGVKTRIYDSLDFHSIFKGGKKLIPITIFNRGNTDAISPKVSISEYKSNNQDYGECYKWKKLSFSKENDFEISLQLPDIKSNSWLAGKDVYLEDFNGYPTVAGTKPDQDWLLWKGNEFCWEVYNGWLQHNVDTQDGRALWTVLPNAKNFEFSMKVTVRDNVYSGVILRDEGDYNTGYIVLVQGIKEHLNNLPSNEGVIQVFKGRFTDGIKSWVELYKSPSIGIRGTHDFFKVKLDGNRFDFWYKNEGSKVPLFSFIDEGNTYTKSSKPVICCHAGYGSVLTYFDDIKMEVDNENGVVWIDNVIDINTKLYGKQLSILKVDFGGVE